jgi:hypothetical protein
MTIRTTISSMRLHYMHAQKNTQMLLLHGTASQAATLDSAVWAGSLCKLPRDALSKTIP